MNGTGTTSPSQIGHESNGNEVVLHIPQRSRTGASPSDDLMSLFYGFEGGGSMNIPVKMTPEPSETFH